MAGLLVIGSVAGVVMNTAVVLPAVLLGHALDVALAAASNRATGWDVAWAALAFVGGTAATELPRIGKRWWLDVARARFLANVRADCLRGVLAWPLDRLATTSVGEVMARVIGDALVLDRGVAEVMIETWDTVLFSVSLVVAMALFDARLTVLALAPVPIALLLAKLSGTWVAGRTIRSRQAASKLTIVLHEQLEGLRVLRLFGRLPAAVDRIRSGADERARAELAAIVLDEGLTAVYQTVLSAGVFAIIWQGGNLVAAGAMTVGALVAFLQLFVRFINRAPRIPLMVNRIQAAGAAYRRLAPLMAPPLARTTEPPLASFRLAYVDGSRLPPPARPVIAGGPISVQVDSITYAYPGSDVPVLHDISLTIPAGSLVAVTGPVGAGKTALANALVGLWPPREGRVLLDGVPLADIPAAERACRIGCLEQAPHLFAGTVGENIALTVDDGATQSPGLDEAVKIAALEVDIATMPAGFATPIGERGTTLSGGQRLRLALARTLVAPGRVPGLLILDDPFSAVDVATEAAIVAALRQAFGPTAEPQHRATIVLFSHRLAVFPYADAIVVLDKGRIREQGTHQDLLAKDGLYRRIYRAQDQLESGGHNVAPRVT